MRAPEQKVEDALRLAVQARGGLCEKIAPIRAGVPDRMVIYGGRVHLVELKAPAGDLRPAQYVFIERARSRGIQVQVLRSVQEVHQWVQGL